MCQTYLIDRCVTTVTTDVTASIRDQPVLFLKPLDHCWGEQPSSIWTLFRGSACAGGSLEVPPVLVGDSEYRIHLENGTNFVKPVLNIHHAL